MGQLDGLADGDVKATVDKLSDAERDRLRVALGALWPRACSMCGRQSVVGYEIGMSYSYDYRCPEHAWIGSSVRWTQELQDIVYAIRYMAYNQGYGTWWLMSDDARDRLADHPMMRAAWRLGKDSLALHQLAKIVTGIPFSERDVKDYESAIERARAAICEVERGPESVPRSPRPESLTQCSCCAGPLRDAHYSGSPHAVYACISCTELGSSKEPGYGSHEPSTADTVEQKRAYYRQLGEMIRQHGREVVRDHIWRGKPLPGGP